MKKVIVKENTDKIDYYFNSFLKWKNELIKKNQFEDDSLFPQWKEIYSYYKKILQIIDMNDFQNNSIEKTVYLIGRDNEDEELIEIIFESAKDRNKLVRSIINSKDVDAKWQLVNCISKNNYSSYINEIKFLFEDENEYVSRIALLALGYFNVDELDNFLERAWNTNNEYQRIAVLNISFENNLKCLQKYLELAKKDGRHFLMMNVIKIEENT